jgi:hypothetical protein
MWNIHFKVIGIKPGPFIMPGIGEVNLANNNLDLSFIQKLYELDCPYLEITPHGLQHLYGVEPEPRNKEQETKNKKQGTTNKEQQTKNNKQRTKNKEQ